MSLNSRIARLEQIAGTGGGGPSVIEDDSGFGPHGRPIHLVQSFHLGASHPELLDDLRADSPAVDEALEMFARCIRAGLPCEMCGHDILEAWIESTGG